MTVAQHSRPLDPAERYFFLLDRLWPMNIVALAELDAALDEGRVRAAWQAVIARVPLASSRIARGEGIELVLEAAPDVAPDVALAPSGPWTVAVRHEQGIPFDASTGPLMRLRCIPTSDGGSALALVVHHAVADARTALWLLRDLIHELAGAAPGSTAAHRLPAPPHAAGPGLPVPLHAAGPGLPVPLHAAGPGLPVPLHAAVGPDRRWADNRHGMLALLRELREERDRIGPPEDVAWHDRAGDGRDPQLDHIAFSRSETAAVTDIARAAGATVHGALSAAWLLAVGALLDRRRAEHRLLLVTPVDLRNRLVPPVAVGAPGMYATLLARTHRIRAGSFAQTARAVSENVRSQLMRGEGELFYALTRPDVIGPDEQGLARLRQMIDAAPQGIAVSNVGIVDDTGDPEWVRSLSFVLAPTPNQLAFAAATTYRDRLTVNLATDGLRVDGATARRLAGEAASHLRPGSLHTVAAARA